ncbi:MAG: response regulator, partial [Myxococcota bacterium]
MTRANLLLVDADPKTLRLLETGLRRAGFAVTPCRTAEDGEEKALLYPHDLVLMDTHLETPEDGFELATRLRNNPATADIPVMFVSRDASVERKVRAVELGVDVYLAKPPVLAEILQSIEGCLARLAHERHDPSTTLPPSDGSLSECSLIELLQEFERGRSTCSLTLTRDDDTASLYLVNGIVYEARLHELEGAAAMARLLTWETGSFHSSDGLPVPTGTSREEPTLDLLDEGLRHLEMIERALEVLPSRERPLDVNAEVLASSLSRLPDAVNEVLRAIDGEATLAEVIGKTSLSEAVALDLCRRLWLAGIVVDAEATLLPSDASP